MLDYIVVSSIPLMILLIIVIALSEKKDVFMLFIEGVIEGIKVVYQIFPYILAITIATSLLRQTNGFDILSYPFKLIFNNCNIDQNIIILSILRPISGGASMAILMDIYNSIGPDSMVSKVASIIMGSSETTIYCITILLGAVKIKKTRGILVAGLIADFFAVFFAIIVIMVFKM